MCSSLAAEHPRRPNSNLPQLRELVEGDRGELAVVAFENEHVAIDFVVEIAVEVERVAAAIFGDDSAEGLGAPVAEADLDLVGHFHTVAGLKGGKGFESGGIGHGS